MRINKVTITNFRSFVGTHTFSFSDHQPGLYAIVGRNEKEPRLGSNGAGKSTIPDALAWGYYGKTLRNLKAGNVCNWDEKKGTKVEIEFEVDGTGYELMRSWTPNGLQLRCEGGEARDVQQSEITQLINLSFDSFCNAVILGQFHNMFFDLPPSAKLQVFSDVMELDAWLERSSTASECSKNIRADVVKARSDLSYVQGRSESLQQAVKEHKRVSDQFEYLKQQRLQELLEVRSRYEQQLEAYEAEKVEKEQLIQESSALLEQYTVRLLKHQSTRQTLDYDLRELSLQMRELSGYYERINEDIRRLNRLEGACPHCLQKVQKSHVEQEKALLLDVRKEVVSQQRLAKKTQEKLENRLSTSEKRIGKIEQDSAMLRTQQGELMFELKALDTAINKLEANLGANEELLTAESNRENPHVKPMQRAERELQECVESAALLQKDIDAYLKRGAAVDYWVSGFKQIRLHLIEESLSYLEVEVNNALTSLGLPDWSVSFDIEKESKSTGNISKGFHVFIHSPSNKEPVPWEAWSGGESQRLRLAGTMGLASLIVGRNAAGLNIEFFDEPTAHLGEEGIHDLLMVLERRAYDQNKQVWVIDHHSHDYGGFKKSYCVVKDDLGSRITSTCV